jgi:hypothetical protein
MDAFACPYGFELAGMIESFGGEAYSLYSSR